MPYLADLDQEIIAREPAMGVHPRTRQPTEVKTVEKVLLASGGELFVCRLCGWLHENMQSVVAHQAGAHRRKRSRGRRYNELTARAVIRAVLRAKQERGQDYAARAAQALNERGLLTLAGKPWTGDNVSRVYNAYVELYPDTRPVGRPRGSKNRTEELEPTSPAAPPQAVPGRRHKTPRVTPVDLSLLAEVNSALVLANHLQDSLTKLVARVEAGEWDNKVDPATVEKARRWDQMKSAFES